MSEGWQDFIKFDYIVEPWIASNDLVRYLEREVERVTLRSEGSTMWISRALLEGREPQIERYDPYATHLVPPPGSWQSLLLRDLPARQVGRTARLEVAQHLLLRWGHLLNTPYRATGPLDLTRSHHG